MKRLTRWMVVGGMALAISARAATLIEANSQWRWLKGTNEATSPDHAVWRHLTFDDSAWASGPAPFFYGEPLSGTMLNDMPGQYSCLFLRRTFVVTNVAEFVGLQLRSLADDGFRAWINGTIVLSQNVPDTDLLYTSTAVTTLDPPVLETNFLSDPARYLVVGTNVLTVQALNGSLVSSDFVFDAALDGVRDTEPPRVVRQLPRGGLTLRELSKIEVEFSEPVAGVDASDLLINGSPASTVSELAPKVYRFEFPQPPPGEVEAAWSGTNGIHDMAVTPNALVRGTWSYQLAPNVPGVSVRISEFLAANLTGLRDEDGDSSDWIELDNAGADTANLDGWFLTDDPQNLTKWRIPAVSLSGSLQLLVFASGKDRANPSAPLHTNFKLAKDGEYLALVDPNMNVVSEFAPAFPPQEKDVSYGRDSLDPRITGFYATPTPGEANPMSGGGIAPEVEFSAKSGTFVQPFALTLSTPLAGAEIRYEIIQSAASAANAPSTISPLYSGPLQITNSMQVRARAFAPGLLPGPLRSESYVRLNTDLLGFSSDLPIVILHTFGSEPYQLGSLNSNHSPGVMMVYEPRGGRSALTNPPTTTSRVGLNVHGGSTYGYPKFAFNLETWDEFNQDKDVALLGMPPESDWLFHAPNNFEPVLIHYPFINELSRQAGRYAPRTRLVEVFLSTNTPSSVIGSNQYNGVYVVLEKIKRNPNRVALERLDPQDTNSPAVTGGYLMKMERVEQHERTFSVPAVGSVPGNNVVYQDPEGPDVQRPERDPQEQYIRSYFAAVATNLASDRFTNATTGYAQFIDTDSWVDQHILNVLAFNVDAFRLGGFLAKPRDRVNERGEVTRAGRLAAGPIYDFDRSLGSTDGRDLNPRVWRSTIGDLGTDFFHYWWFDRLFRDPDFWQRWIDRWQELRLTTFSLGNMTRVIDSLREELREAQPREERRWGTVVRPRSGGGSFPGFSYSFGTNGYEGEITFLKHWLSNRVDFIDTNFVGRPRLAVSGDAVSGYRFSLTGPVSPSAVIYYTLDGTDPRLPGGALAPGATVYTEPMVVTSNARIVARVRDLAHRNLTGPNNPPLSSPWSSSVSQTLVVSAPPLRITELMYHPSSDPQRPLQFEFIELRNIGAPLNLRGFRLRGDVEFTFPDLTLDRGQYVVVVGDRAGFQARYGSGARVAGQYQTALGNDSGHILLEGPLGETIHDFSYSDQWYPVTDGLGFSLVIQSEYLPLREQEEGEIVDNWNQSNNWRPSASVYGSPGSTDPPRPVIAGVLVNEVLARPVPGQTAFIELFNQHGPDANLGGWFLSDEFNTPKKFRIPDGTMLPVGGYVVFDETQFNAVPSSSNSFGLRATGDEVFLFSVDAAGNLSGYAHGFRFGPSLPGVSFGRYLSIGAGEEYVAQSARTPGAANAGPRIGPVVISEIMYHPVDFGGPGARTDNADEEYIELKNITDSPLALFDSNQPTNSWRLGGDGVAFTFPTGVTLPARSYALIVRFAPVREAALLTAFRTKFGVPDGVPVFGPFTGTLNNDGALVELLAPEKFVFSATRSELAFVRVDHVRYSAEEPWPAGANGIGPSLNRIVESAYGNDPFHWAAAARSPGASYVQGELPVITQQPQSQTRIAYQQASFSVTASGPGPLSYQWRFNGSPIYGATDSTLVLPVADPSQAGLYDVIVLNPSGAVASSAAALVLQIPMQFTVQPQSQSRRPGESANFAVAVESTAPPVRYQWFFNGSAIPGAIDAGYSIPSVAPANGGAYHCAVTDGVSVSNSVVARLSVLVRPLIVQQPLSQTAVRGATVVFSVQVSNTVTLPIGYRWRRMGSTTNYQELNSLTSYLVLTNVPANSPVSYTVVVTNLAGGILSSNAVLTILLDADGDGLPDEFEAANGLNPNDAADAPDDRDGDTMTNLEEYISGTDPQNPFSYLKVDRISISGAVQLEFIAVSNKTYTVQSTAALGIGTWSNVANVTARTNTRPLVITDSMSGTNRFYRLVTPAQPY